MGKNHKGAARTQPGMTERRIKRFWDKTDKHGPIIPKMNTPCWIWLGAPSKAGYGRMGVRDKVLYTHYISWLLHYGDIPKGMIVCHKCDNRICVNPEHLFLGTYRDNTYDAIEKGRLGAKLKPNDSSFYGLPRTEVILKLSKQGEKHREIAAIYGLSRGRISQIIAKERKKNPTLKLSKNS